MLARSGEFLRCDSGRAQLDGGARRWPRRGLARAAACGGRKRTKQGYGEANGRHNAGLANCEATANSRANSRAWRRGPEPAGQLAMPCQKKPLHSSGLCCRFVPELLSNCRSRLPERSEGRPKAWDGAGTARSAVSEWENSCRRPHLNWCMRAARGQPKPRSASEAAAAASAAFAGARCHHYVGACTRGLLAARRSAGP